MENKFTKGPWILSKSAITGIAVTDWEGWHVIAHVPNSHGVERQQANANLIAAAPEMYEALEEIADHEAGEAGDGYSMRKIAKEILEKIKVTDYGK